MNNDTKEITFGLFGAPGYLSLALLFAKIFGVIDISIWIVLLPVLISTSIVLIALIAAIIIAVMRD